MIDSRIKNKQGQLEKKNDNRNNAQIRITKREDIDMLLKTVPSQEIKTEIFIRPAKMTDLEEVVELLEICSNHMIGKNEVSLSDVKSEWLLPKFDLETATRIALTPEGKIVGYIEVWDIDEIPVRIWVWGRVHPDYEELGLGTFLMRWAEKRARKTMDKVPGDLKVTMQAGSFSSYKPAHNLFHDLGMETIRHFYTMAIELDGDPAEPQWPGGIQVRSLASEEEVRDVVWAIEDAFKDHWGYVENPFEEEYQRWLHFIRNDEKFDPSLWFLAMDGGEIAGISLCKKQSNEDPDMGWIDVLGVRRPWRKRGLGLALLHHSFTEFHRRGKSRVGLGVDADSLTGATRLYERAGMKPIRQFTVSEKVLQLGRDITTKRIET